MTHKERMLAAMRSSDSDRIPWAPRMDLWYIANKAKGTLPSRFNGMNTAQIARELDCACHCVRADYTIARTKEDLLLRGFGIDNHPDYPYRVELRGLQYEFHHDDENLYFRVNTPAGEISTHIKLSREMLKDGISLPFIESYPIESVDDLERVAVLFEHLEVVPTPENYANCRDRIGDQGLAVANGLPVASPVHFMLHDLMAMDVFYFMYADSPEEIRRLDQRMTPFFERALEATLQCDCEAFFWGGNFDDTITYKPFFQSEIVPWLQKARKRADEMGKICVSHTDGENKGLLDVLPKSGMHVAESFCPAPMTQCSLREFRAALGQSVAVWGGIPAVALLADSMSQKDFEGYLESVFTELGTGHGLIFGVSDNVPPEADLERLDRIAEKIEEFGPVNLSD